MTLRGSRGASRGPRYPGGEDADDLRMLYICFHHGYIILLNFYYYVHKEPGELVRRGVDVILVRESVASVGGTGRCRLNHRKMGRAVTRGSHASSGRRIPPDRRDRCRTDRNVRCLGAGAI